MNELHQNQSGAPDPELGAAANNQTESQRQLIAAIKLQSLEGVNVALALGADPNAYDQNHSMLGLHEDAAWSLSDFEQPTWLGILKALLVAGANPNQTADQRFGDLLLHGLSQHSHLQAMQLMLDHGADPNLIFEDTALDWLSLDYSYQEICNISAWYKERVLPEYDVTPEESADDSETTALWLVSRHQRGWAMLRRAGGLFAWELRQGPVTEVLQLSPDRLGGLYTRHARPESAFLESLGSALMERLARWTRDYADPDLLGYEAESVTSFDYAAHLNEGMAIGQAIAPLLPAGTVLEIVMPTAESIAAKCTMVDLYVWRTEGKWEKTVDWRDKLSADWFDPEPSAKLAIKSGCSS